MYLWWYLFSSKLLSITPSNFGYLITINPSELSVNKTNWENELGRHLVCYTYIYMIIYIYLFIYISLYFPFISRAYPWLPSLLIWFPSWRRFCCSAGVTSSESKKIRSVMRSFSIILNHLKGQRWKSWRLGCWYPQFSSILVGSSAINHALWGTPHGRQPPHERFMMMTTKKGGWNLLIYC